MPKSISPSRADLLREVQQRLIPAFTDMRGFVSAPLSQEEAHSAEFRRSFPFGKLHRFSGDTLHVVEIQFDQHGEPRFVINFGISPKEGVVLPWTRLDQIDAPVSALPNAWRLYSSWILNRWFTAAAIFSRGHDSGSRNVVDRALALLPEIDNWFRDGVVGKHMAKFGYS